MGAVKGEVNKGGGDLERGLNFVAIDYTSIKSSNQQDEPEEDPC